MIRKELWYIFVISYTIFLWFLICIVWFYYLYCISPINVFSTPLFISNKSSRVRLVSRIREDRIVKKNPKLYIWCLVHQLKFGIRKSWISYFPNFCLCPNPTPPHGISQERKRVENISQPLLSSDRPSLPLLQYQQPSSSWAQRDRERKRRYEVDGGGVLRRHGRARVDSEDGRGRRDPLEILGEGVLSDRKLANADFFNSFEKDFDDSDINWSSSSSIKHNQWTI